MNFRNIFHILGALLFFLGLTMFFPLLCSLYYRDGDLPALFSAAIITTLTGGLLYVIFRKNGRETPLTHKEGFFIVAAGWILAGIFGALPFLFSGVITSFGSAFFEAVSGFTTTGATVLVNLDSMAHGIHLWRSLTQWLGGMGIILLSVAILPLLGVGGMQLYKAELPSPVKDKITPRVTQTARTLWIVYIIISTLEFSMLLLGGMSVFDALCHTFTTMATGGFSTSDASIAHFNSPYIDGVITFFMFVAGINFTLHYYLLVGNPGAYVKDSEFRFYAAVIVLASFLVIIDLRLNLFSTITESFRYGIFQVVSIMTTTGYATHNFNDWPSFSKMVLLVLMFVGGSAGSTGGAIKCLRVLLILKHGYIELYRLVHPHAVRAVKLRKKIVSQDIMASIWGFIILYLVITLSAAFILSFLGLDMMTAFSAVAATIGNVGPGFSLVNAASTYADIPSLGKWVLSFCMLAGRLEIYTIMILLIPEFWKR
ncbi:MAG: TrkH family potassium uptake protein [Deltaproteobacteria bacterium]|nr:TrkH family potassium uptake protein [Deltaproteobacteria bacterium]